MQCGCRTCLAFSSAGSAWCWSTANPCWSRWICLKEAVALQKICSGAGSRQDLWYCGERGPCWSRFAGRTCDPMVEPCWGSLFLKEVERIHAGTAHDEL